uniref:Non-heme iron enzyme n=1 Tax=Talaromyces purpureogenus TaxID=1266744 RepID=UPI001FE24344|nr:Chain B, Fe(II)/(alpha)ketoglutarate-dependent dioxygenase TlxI [Talaromyces purpureogenus]7VBR_A Chain A, Fe(II)/(alpha)ketoglutarate-dependent dioxygenase TlxI [Talaromyces purpureogenus]7VBR_B Chain B, Fe(II)/(alpha)ketoglutarate-dependent dioxygenase TlxI [Talaromyces purpureogenus]7VBR_C Chain C, Fe(II)/(alpha)ketoglutarate-dependent dioxygenase TlxI [Talaromyces purpureogenus]7VBR_D Chain D, Fe(II)/(alpha)ketoglutarate-dependent dioxygenase TlxI [Talaromyces purpureogenus]
MAILATDSSVPRKVDLTTPLDEVMRQIKQDGVIIVQGFFDLKAVQKFQDEVDAAMKYDKVIKRQWHYSNLAVISETFRDDFLNHKWMHALCNEIFGADWGSYWVNLALALHLEPGRKGERFHSDVQHYTASKLRRNPNDPEFMINFLVALTDLGEDSGATSLVPGSHLLNAGDPPATEAQAVPAILKPGDAVVYFGSVFHGIGENRSSQLSRAINVSFFPTQFTPLDSHLFVPKDIVETMTPLAQQMIGWRTSENQNKIPFWQAGDDRIEDVLALKSKEVSV